MFELSLLSSGLRFDEVVDAEVWHQDVQLFSVFDLSSGELMGYFYLDIYRRFIFNFVFCLLRLMETILYFPKY